MKQLKLCLITMSTHLEARQKYLTASRLIFIVFLSGYPVKQSLNINMHSYKPSKHDASAMTFYPIPVAVLKDRGLWEQDDLILVRLRILTSRRSCRCKHIKKLRLNVIFKEYRRRPYGQCIKNIQQRKTN